MVRPCDSAPCCSGRVHFGNGSPPARRAARSRLCSGVAQGSAAPVTPAAGPPSDASKRPAGRLSDSLVTDCALALSGRIKSCSRPSSSVKAPRRRCRAVRAPPAMALRPGSLLWSPCPSEPSKTQRRWASSPFSKRCLVLVFALAHDCQHICARFVFMGTLSDTAAEDAPAATRCGLQAQIHGSAGSTHACAFFPC